MISWRIRLGLWWLRTRRRLIGALNRALGPLAKALLGLLGRLDPDRASDWCGAIARRCGPWLPAHRIGRENLRAAYPDKNPAWIEATLRDAWDNLGRVVGEYAHLGAIARTGPDARVRVSEDAVALFRTLLEDGKPALCFSAHLGNWEVPAVVIAEHGMPSAVVYRMPNNEAVAKEIMRIRAPLMGRMIRTQARAALEMAAALEVGLHLGMLVDQRFSRGVDITFLNRPCKANPSIARLARRFDCPVVGVYVVRHPDRVFELRAEGPFTLPRDDEGEVDARAATQMINDVVAGWVRENPGQWLWFHRRWR
jgi:KDO2-lipid IV(A) lauroyltransferase